MEIYHLILVKIIGIIQFLLNLFYSFFFKSFCIHGSRTFTGFLLLSVETLTTIGFGTSYPLHSCGERVWMVMMLETLANVTINGALVTAVYVKVTRPLTKDSTRIFSKKSVVSVIKRKI